MAEEKKTEVKETDKMAKEERATKVDNAPAAKPENNKKDSSGSAKKKEETKKPEIKKKELAVMNGKSLRLSLKHCVAICKMIKGRTPERAVEFLDGVSRGKVAVHMKASEVAHQKGKGVSGAKYPKKAALEMMDLVKQLAANSQVNGIENPVIVVAKANKASRPFRRAGRRAKRCHVYLEARSKKKGGKK